VAATTRACLLEEEEDETKKKELRLRKAVLAARTDWEARRLQQIFKEVEREMELQRDLELRAQGERLRLQAEARVEGRRVELLLALKADAAAQREANELKLREDLAAFAKEHATAAEEASAAKLADLRREKDEALRSLTAEAADRNAEVLDRNTRRVLALEAEIATCLDRLHTKASTHSRQAETHRATAAALHRAQALETLSSDDDGGDLSVVGGVPEIRHLETRFRDRVEKTTKRWLLVPPNLGPLLGQALAYVADFLGLDAPPLGGDSDELKRHVATLQRATDALERSGDLKACVALLSSLPRVHPFTQQPSPCLDWLEAATARLQADQDAKLLRAKTSLLNAAHVAAASASSSACGGPE